MKYWISKYIRQTLFIKFYSKPNTAFQRFDSQIQFRPQNALTSKSDRPKRFNYIVNSLNYYPNSFVQFAKYKLETIQFTRPQNLDSRVRRVLIAHCQYIAILIVVFVLHIFANILEGNGDRFEYIETHRFGTAQQHIISHPSSSLKPLD